MIFSENFFGKKNVEDITFEDLVSFFEEEREESDHIEFKSFVDRKENNIKDKFNGVVKAISAFLNSDGGILIWGAPIGEKQDGKKEKVFKGELSLVEIKYEKDQFINKISDLITPLPSVVNFHALEKGGKYAYIIEVQKSEYSPHQFQHKYFMRLDAQTRPAPHHYIEALFKKIKYPQIEGYLAIRHNSPDNLFQKLILHLDITVFNKTPLQNEEDVLVILSVDNAEFKDTMIYNGNDKVTFSRFPKNTMVINSHAKILHFGNPVKKTVPIELTIGGEKSETINFLNVELKFAGKNSPMKQSRYRIEINKKDAEHFETNLVSKDENKLLSDLV